MSLAETDGRTEADDRPIARAVAILLLMGVGLSATVIAVGLALLLLTGQTGYPEPPTPATLRLHEEAAVFPITLGGVLRGAAAMKPFAVIESGLLLLIATPVLRVAASVVLFIREGDRRYTAITAIVLVLLLVSIFWIG